ncbi:MAG: ABC transporter substrate-binding protein [Firmicutes bacterium]|nr:ABC transporter substrate-binding protein [Bacillota bacterium]
MKKRGLIMLICVAALLISSGCTQQSEKIIFGDVGWDSMKFHNAVAMYIAETAYDLETEEISGSTPVTYGALKKGDIHLYMETWTDNIPAYSGDVQSGELIELGVNYDDNIQGLYVPRYVVEGDPSRGIEPLAPDLKMVEDLKNYKDVFTDPEDASKGRIYGSISGWEIDEIMRKKVEYYGLDEFYNYIDPGSDAALSASIAGAYEKGEPIVAYYWEPTWITGKYDLLLLEDAPYEESLYRQGKCECPSVRLTVCANPQFVKDNPEFVEFLSKYSTSSELTSKALMYINENNAEYADAAKWFLVEYDNLLDEWLPSDKAELVRGELLK